jgi:protein ImuB
MELSAQKRWAAIWLRRLSTDRLKRLGAPDNGNGLVVYVRTGNALLLDAVDDAAARLGIRTGMTLADARAQRPQMHVVEADPMADTAVLDRIAGFCERWTPAIALDGRDGIALDITETSHLFGGEQALAEEVVSRITARGFKVRIAFADTAAAAWAIARFGAKRCAQPGETAQALTDMPIRALRLEEKSEALLNRLGLKTIGMLISRPRAPFAARAGEAAMACLDEALGRIPCSLEFRHPPPAIFAPRRFLEPLITADALMIAAGHAAAEVAERLERVGLGARRLTLTLFAVSGRTRRITVGFSAPERDEKALTRPFREKLNAENESADLEFGVEAIRLDVVETGRFETGDTTNTARFVDALSARLGAQAVRRIACADRHIPELAHTSAPAIAGAPETHAPARNLRPITLLTHPEPIEAVAPVPDGPPRRFRWRRVLREVVRAQGPERIAPEWHNEPDALTRDYFHVEDASGARFWLYREGLYERETDAPRWYLHGLFA